jgi:CDP-diacylglycerol--serine O-phosphatidyltransferase
LAAIAMASKIGKVGVTTDLDAFYLALSGWLILAAMLFDTLDGYAARMARATSAFGAELDSLCDAISFGAAPAFLLLQLGPSWEQPLLHQALAVLATAYLLAVLLRLARFNVEAQSGTSSKRFRGLPSPAAAGCVAALAIVRGGLAWQWPMYDIPATRGFLEATALCGTPIIAGLMVSSLPYPHLTKQLLRGRRAWSVVLPALIVLFLLRDVGLIAVFWIYALTGPFQRLSRRSQREIVPAPAGTGLDEVLRH